MYFVVVWITFIIHLQDPPFFFRLGNSTSKNVKNVWITKPDPDPGDPKRLVPTGTRKLELQGSFSG